MAARVVHRLDAVQIAHRDRRGTLPGPTEPLRNELAERLAVQQSGRRIELGACLDAAQLFAVRTIEEHEADREEREREQLEQRSCVGFALPLCPERAVRDQGQRTEREEEPRAHAPRSSSAPQCRDAECRDRNRDRKVGARRKTLERHVHEQAHPTDDFAVIVRASSRPVNGHRAERAAAAVGRANGKTGRALSIVGGTSARLTGHEILELAKDSDVAYISSDDLVVASFDPTGGAALAASPGILEVGAPDAWRQLGVTGRGIGVAILDSGIAPHPDLAGRIVAAVDFTNGQTNEALVAPAHPGGHGTHVAGLVAAGGTASGGAYPGVAPGANLIAVPVISGTWSTTVSTLIAGMQWVLAHRSAYNIR